MKIQTITVTAGRTFNHPHEQYSNLRPEVQMTATLALITALCIHIIGWCLLGCRVHYK